ncbi:MAG: SusE domain-containing protein [Cytophagales bacterium]|jgi:hypothetical protein|nr:SusE domain-containing protein [Cytophagales bacterium]
MKRILSIITVGALALLVANTACEREEGLNLNLTAPDSLRTPANDVSVRIDLIANPSVVFEWKPGQAADGALLLYEVAFDKENGDFSNPVFKLASDGNGVQPKATIQHRDLNKIAGLAGIAALAKGKLKWTVLASKGTNVQQAAQTRLVNVERPAGFSEIPVDLYLTGDATEFGTELSRAARLQQTRVNGQPRPGEFEIYTSLKAGTYRFLNRNTGTPVAFSLRGNLIQEGGTTTVTGAAKVYRINLDFNRATVQLTEIKEMGLWVSARERVTVTLPYVSNGMWKIENTPIEFVQQSWGRDERYKFRMRVNDGTGEDKNEWLGSSNADNQRATSSTPPAYFFLFPIAESQWDFTYKFATEVDGKNVDISVMLNSTAANYIHEVKIR